MSIGNSEDARIEVDSLGEVYVPRQMLYGSHTVRALENFPITGVPIGSMRELVRAYGAVKKAAAIANCELGVRADRILTTRADRTLTRGGSPSRPRRAVDKSTVFGVVRPPVVVLDVARGKPRRA